MEKKNVKRADNLTRFRERQTKLAARLAAAALTGTKGNSLQARMALGEAQAIVYHQPPRPPQPQAPAPTALKKETPT